MAKYLVIVESPAKSKTIKNSTYFFQHTLISNSNKNLGILYHHIPKRASTKKSFTNVNDFFINLTT